MVDFRAILLASAFLIAVLPAAASAAPQAYLTENVDASYSYGGSLLVPVSRTGTVEVSAGSMSDVLQQVRLTLSSTEGTNLVSDVSYRNVAASPGGPLERTVIFANTTNSSEDISYRITNESLAPLISMSMDYSNQQGGREIAPGTNAFSFVLNMSSSQALAGASLVIQARRNTYGVNDSISFQSASVPSGSYQIIDTDSDGFYDRITWLGDLPEGSFLISFAGTIVPGVNYQENLMMVDTDESLTQCSYSQAQTFTGMTFSSRFSRGPVREGIEILQLGSWVARGFMKNIAAETTYTLHGWELYQLGNPVPVLTSSESSYVLPGQTEYTEWHDSGFMDKPAYYSAAFDWEAVWGSSGYQAASTSMMSSPVLYGMDAWADSSGVIQSNSGSGKVIAFNSSARHLGHSSVGVNGFRLVAELPGISESGDPISWTPSQVRVYYSNGSGDYEITAFANVSTSGSLDVRLDSLYSALGHYMGQNDDVIVSYLVSGPVRGQNQDYVFSSNVTLITVSGTPVTKVAQVNLTVPGVAITPEPGGPGGGGGGGGAAPSPFVDIVKESSDAYFLSAGTVKVMVTAGVVDNGGKGVKDVKVFAYVPVDAQADTNSFSLRIFHNSTGTWETMAQGIDFTVTDRGVTSIGRDQYREYMVKRATPGNAVSEYRIDMLGGDKIEVAYKVSVPFGTSYLLTRISGYSYYLDKLIFEDAFTPVRREAASLEKLQVEESEWMQGEAVIGKPVVWKKTFRVYNPNNVSVEETMATSVFQDSLKVEISEIGSEDKTRLSLKGGEEIVVNWDARMRAGERKTYLMEATTPPVLERNREANAVEISKTSVTIVLNLTIENFARERYSNVSTRLSIRKNKIIMISDASVVLEQDGSGVIMTIPAMDGLEVRNISITYLETPPTMATTLDALRYSCTDYARVNILVVPSETDSGSYIETTVVGPDPNLIVAHAELMDLAGSEPYEEVRIPMLVSLTTFPSGKYYIYTKFRKDFGTILSDRKEFFVDCPGRDMISISWVFVLAISGAIVLLLGIRVYRKKTYEKEMQELKKKAKEI